MNNYITNNNIIFKIKGASLTAKISALHSDDSGFDSSAPY